MFNYSKGSKKKYLEAQISNDYRSIKPDGAGNWVSDTSDCLLKSETTYNLRTLAFKCHSDFDDEICEMGSKLKAIWKEKKTYTKMQE